jgi:hypothetical protein
VLGLDDAGQRSYSTTDGVDNVASHIVQGSADVCAGKEMVIAVVTFIIVVSRGA